MNVSSKNHRLHVILEDRPTMNTGQAKTIALALDLDQDYVQHRLQLQMRGVGVLLADDDSMVDDDRRPHWLRAVYCAFDLERPCSFRCAAFVKWVGGDYHCARLPSDRHGHRLTVARDVGLRGRRP